MEPQKVRLINSSPNPAPEYSTSGSAGMDIRAFLDSPVIINPGCRALIPTGLRVELPEGYEMQLRPRSGLAIRHGVTLLNSPGTIDSDYRGEIGVIMVNLGSEPFTINPGDRICQAVVASYVRVQWENAVVLTSTERGDGGFGHSGLK